VGEEGEPPLSCWWHRSIVQEGIPNLGGGREGIPDQGESARGSLVVYQKLANSFQRRKSGLCSHTHIHFFI